MPAISVKFPGPFTGPVKVIPAPAGVPPLFVVSTVALPLKVTVLAKPTVPPGVLNVELPPLKTTFPKLMGAAATEVLMTPKTVVRLAVLVSPPAKVRLGEEPLCNVTPPVLIKDVAGVIVPPLLKIRL